MPHLKHIRMESYGMVEIARGGYYKNRGDNNLATYRLSDSKEAKYEFRVVLYVK